MCKNVNILKKIEVISIMCIAIAFTHCTEPMDINLNSIDKKVVIYGTITTDTCAQCISITQSADYYDNSTPTPISNATVFISDGQNAYPLTESVNEPGKYYTDANFHGETGTTYTLTASNVMLDYFTEPQTYSATATIPSLPDNYQTYYVDSIKVEYNSNWEGWEVNCWANEPSDQNDYYMFRVYINDVLYSDSIENLVLSDDKLINGSSTGGATLYFISEPDTLKVGDKVTLDLCILDKDYYLFLVEAQTSIQPQIPLFSGPSANVRTNISNDALGFFGAFAIIKTSYIMRPEDIQKKNDSR
ncbi:MAG TPA: DUF4249 domain-containing protein [Tenuifilaceae bacterium]|nr:DUF4249 domain-containing protein [Tenuifilaceae bacterium]